MSGYRDETAALQARIANLEVSNTDLEAELRAHERAQGRVREAVAAARRRTGEADAMQEVRRALDEPGVLLPPWVPTTRRGRRLALAVLVSVLLATIGAIVSAAFWRYWEAKYVLAAALVGGGPGTLLGVYHLVSRALERAALRAGAARQRSRDLEDASGAVKAAVHLGIGFAAGCLLLVLERG